MCAAPSAFVCIEINAIRNMELFLCCFKHTAIILHITVATVMGYRMEMVVVRHLLLVQQNAQYVCVAFGMSTKMS